MYAVDSHSPWVRPRPYEVRRQEPRYVSSVPVVVQRFLRFGPSLTRGMSLDISVRGMSAMVCSPPEVGETVVIDFPLPDTSIEMLATVRYSKDAKSGFEFYPLSPAAARGLQKWIEELRKHEEKLFPYRYAAML